MDAGGSDINIDALLQSLRERSIANFNFENHVVLLRLDINSPVKDGKITSPEKMRAHYPTIMKLVEDGARVVVISHQGRPNEGDFISLKEHSQILSRQLKIGIDFIADNRGEEVKARIRKMSNGQVAVLENIRFNIEETKKFDDLGHSRSKLVRDLSEVGTVYVNDAFASIHRSHASIVGFPVVMPSFVGLHMLQEVTSIARLYESASKPILFIMGGGKVEDAMKYISSLANGKGGSKIAITGLIGNIFLLAGGFSMGADTPTLQERYRDLIAKARELISNSGKNIILPIDVGVMQNGIRRDFEVDKVPYDGYVLDIGEKTVSLIERAIGRSKTVVMRGPAGVIEREGFDLGTLNIMQAVAKSKKYTVIAGGHTQRIVSKYGLENKINGHMSTGGGAVISLMIGKRLPALDSIISNRKDINLIRDAQRKPERERVR